MKHIDSLRKYFRERSYYVGIIDYDPLAHPFSFDDVKWINLNKYKHGWFADPFLYKITDTEIHVLAEEFEYHNEKGRLVYLIIDRLTLTLISVDVILDIPTHLSFPIYIKENGKVYVYPENYQSGSLKIYEFDETSKKLINPVAIIDEPLLDTQILKLNGKYYAMGIVYADDGQAPTRSLKIYKSDALFGPYSEFQTIENIFCEERGAGLIFIDNNRIIRPAQCCEGGYGLAVIFYELKFNGDRFEETELKRIEPVSSLKNGLGLHTYNKLDSIAIIDGNEYRHYRPARILAKITGK